MEGEREIETDRTHRIKALLLNMCPSLVFKLSADANSGLGLLYESMILRLRNNK